MNVCEHLTATARVFPDREAIWFEGVRFTYRELDRLSISAAKLLSDAGIRTGDRVALMLPNVPSFVIWYYATLRLGAIAVSISTRLMPTEVAAIVGDCNAKVFVGEAASSTSPSNDLPECVDGSFFVSDLGDKCDDRPLPPDDKAISEWVDRSPNDAALILYTSGTTGVAKGATLSHINVRSNVHAFNHLCGMRSDDRILLAVPLFHCFGQNALLNSALNVGATIVLQRGFDLSEAKRLIVDQRVTQLYGVPMMFQLFFDSCDAADLTSVEYCFSAAATLPIQLSQRWLEKFGMPINEGYGLTETSPFASYNHHLQLVHGSIGAPIDCVEMRIVDIDTGHECSPGEFGEIVIRGPNVMLGYWNREQATRDAIRNGWFHSGDLGRMDDRGYFYIVDRVKDMLSVGGLKVYPAEVERVLLGHPDVYEAAVVGVPDDVFGEQVIAFVVLQPGVSDRDRGLIDIRRHAEMNLGNYKVPRRFIPIDELPRNPAGKVLKTKLREYDLSPNDATSTVEFLDVEADRPTDRPVQRGFDQPRLRKQIAETHASSRPRVACRFVQELVQTISGSDSIPEPDVRFLDAGLDSLMMVELSNRIQHEVGPESEVPATLVFDHPRICDLSDYVLSILSSDGSTRESSIEHVDQVELSDPSGESSLPGLRVQLESMTEREALEELMKELDN